MSTTDVVAPAGDPGPPDAGTAHATIVHTGTTHVRTTHAHDQADRQPDGRPTAYLTGRETFLGIELIVAPGALVPRRETEILGRAALDVLRERFPRAPRVADVCCGVGNLGCAIAAHVPDARVWASDLTDGCITLARRNVDHLGLGDRVAVHQGDLLGAYDGLGLDGTLDVVVANPPYISTARLTDGDRRSLEAHEPREAFDGGPYGLTIHQRLIREAPQVLRGRGVLLFEFGLGQERQVELLFRRAKAYESVRFVDDDDGHPRVAVATLAPLAAGRVAT